MLKTMKKDIYIRVLFSLLFLNGIAQQLTLANLDADANSKNTYILPSGSSAKIMSSNFNENIVLKKQEVFEFNFMISKLDSNISECRDCTSSAGIEISGYKFLIENNKKDLRLYVGKAKSDSLPFYIINRFSENIEVKLFIKYTVKGFDWVIQSPKKTIGETIEVSINNKIKPKFIYQLVSGSSLQYKVSDFDINTLKLPDFQEAELHPLYKYKETAIEKTDWDENAAKHLVLESTKGKITKKEWDGFEKYLLEYQLPSHNYMNYYFRKRFNSYMLEWLYKKKKNIALLNKAIQVAQRSIQYRNDNFGKYQISYDRSVAPLWPNYKETEVYDDGSIGLEPGASVFAGLPPITVPIRMISENPSIWSETFNGITYKQIALNFIDEALKTIDYTYDVFVGDDHLIKYPNTVLREEWHHKVFIYNRVFPVMSGAIPLVDALETFNMYPEKKDKINAVNQAMINRLKEDITLYEENGKECMKYPYSEAMHIKNPKKFEDFTHGAFDSRDFQLFYLSHKYDFSDQYVNAMANTLVDVAYKGEKGFSNFIDGKGKPRHFPTLISYIGYIWYATYRPEVYDILIDYIIKNNIVYKNGRYDSYFIFEMLKLKDANNAK